MEQVMVMLFHARDFLKYYSFIFLMLFWYCSAIIIIIIKSATDV